MKRLYTIMAFAALTCTCGNVINDGEPPPVAATPRDVLQLLEYSFNHRDVETLKPCLDENFVFYIDPEEMGRYPGGGYNAPSSYTAFRHTAENMFRRAYTISMSLDAAGVGEPDPEENTYRAGCRVYLLVMVTEHGGFLARGYANFEFEKYPDENGEDRWRIVKWWDHTLPAEGEGGAAEPKAGVERASVAAILAYFQK
jgi:hypothetical protein